MPDTAPIEFSLQQEERGVVLAFENARVGPVIIERVALAVPEASDLSAIGADAAAFRHRRLPAVAAAFRANEHDLRRFLANLVERPEPGRDDADADANLRFTEIDGRLRAGYALWLAHVVGPTGSADFSCRASVKITGFDEISVSTSAPHLYGHVGVAAASVGVALLKRLAHGLGGQNGVTTVGPVVLSSFDRIRFRPLDVLMGILPRLGFRMPERKGLTLAEARIKTGTIFARYTRRSTTHPMAMAALTAATASAPAEGPLDALPEVAAALAAGTDQEAARLIRAQRPSWETLPAAWPAVCDVLAAASESAGAGSPATRTGTAAPADDAQVLALRLLENEDAALTGLLCLARLALARGDTHEAAERYAEAARITEAVQATPKGNVDAEEVARIYVARGRALETFDAEQAVVSYEEAIARTDAPAPLLEALADLHERMGQREQVIAILRRLLALGEEMDGARSYVRLAFALHSAGDVDAARAEMERALAVAGNEEVLAGVVHFGGDDAGLQWAERVLHAERERAVASGWPGYEALAERCLAELLSRAGRWEEARAHVARARELNPADVSIALRAADIDEAVGLTAEAVALWEATLSAAALDDVGRRQVLCRIARAEMQGGERRRARAAIQSAVTIGADAETLELARQIAESENDPTWEVEILRRLTVTAEGAARGAALVRLGRLLGERTARPDEAVAVLERAISSAHPASPAGDTAEIADIRAQAMKALADLWAQLGNVDAQRRALERLAAEPPPAGPQASLWLGELLLRAGDVRGARRHLEAADQAGIADAFETLRAAMEATGDTRTLERWLLQVAESGPEERRGQAYRELGRIRLERGDAEGARRAYDAVVARDRSDLAALRGLSEAAWRLDQWETAATALQRLVELAAPEERATSGVRLGEALERLADVVGAARAYDGSLEAGVRGALARQALTRRHAIASDRGEMEQAAQVARTAATHESAGFSARERAAWFVRAAEHLRHGLGKEEESEASLRLALQCEPGNLAALDALEAIYRERAAWKDLAETLHRKAGALGKRPAEARAVLERLAILQAGPLGMPDHAGDTYLRILENDPGHLVALRYLANLAFARGRDDEVEAFDARLVSLDLPFEELRSIRLRRARRALDRGHDGDAEHELRSILHVDSEDRAALDLYEEMLVEGPPSQALAVVLSKQLKLATDDAVRADIARRFGDCLRGIGRSNDAIGAYQLVLTLRPGDIDVLRALADAERTARRYGDLCDTLEVLAEALGKGADGAAVWRDVGETALRQLGNTQRAARAFSQAEQAASDPWRSRLDQAEVAAYEGNTSALRELAAEAQSAGELQNAIGALERLLRIADDDPVARGRLLLRLADLESRVGHDARARLHIWTAAEDLDVAGDRVPPQERAWMLAKVAELFKAENDLEMATDRYRAALAIDASCEPALSGLEAIARQAGDLLTVVDVLRKQAAQQRGAARSIKLREAATLLTDLERADEALTVLEELLADQPGDSDAASMARLLVRQAGDPKRLALRLEADLKQLPATAQSHNERVALLRELAELYDGPLADRVNAQRHWQTLCTELERALDADASAPVTREPILRVIEALDHLTGHLDDKTRATPYLERLRTANFLGAEADRLAQAYRAARRFADLVELTTERARATSGSDAARLWTEAAILFEDTLHDEGRAADAWQKALASDPTAVGNDIARARSRLMASGDAAAALTALEQEIQRSAPDAKAALRGERGLLLVRMMRPHDARGDLEFAAKADPRLYPVRAALGVLLETNGENEAALPHLLAAAEAHEDTKTATDCALRAGKILESMGRRVEAATRYERTLTRNPNSEATLRAIIALGGPPSVHGDRLATLASLVADPMEKATLLGRAATAWVAARRDMDAYQALRAAAAQKEFPDTLLTSLADMARARADWQVLADALQERAARESDATRAAAIRLDLATVRAEQLHDPEPALILFEAAAESGDATVRNAALAALERLYGAQGRVKDAARVAEARVAHAGDEAERAARAVRAAELAERAGQTGTALRLYAEAAEVPGAAGQAAALTLARLAPRDDDETRRHALSLLHAQVAHAADADARDEIWHAILQLAGRVNDFDQMQAAAQAILAERPGDDQAFAALRAHFEARKADADLARLLEARMAVPGIDESEAADLALQLGRLAERTGAAQEATSAYERAVAARPDDVTAIEALAELAWRARAWERAEGFFARLEGRVTSMPTDELAFRRGVVAEARGDLSQAEAYWRRAIELEPSHPRVPDLRGRMAAITPDAESAVTELEALLSDAQSATPGDPQREAPADPARALDLREQLGLALARAGQDARAREELQAVWSADDQRLEVANALAEIAERAGDLPLAGDLFERAAASTTATVDARARAQRFVRAGDVHLAQGNSAAAERNWRLALEQDSSLLPVHERLLAHGWQQGELGALAPHAAAIANGPRPSETGIVQVRAALLRATQGIVEPLVEQPGQSGVDDQQRLHALLELAAILRANNRPIDALDGPLDVAGDVRASLEDLVRASPADLHARRVLARVLDRRRDLRLAWVHYGIAAFIDPEASLLARYRELAPPDEPNAASLEQVGGPLRRVLSPLMPLLEGFLAPLDAYPRAEEVSVPMVGQLRSRIGGAHAQVMRLPGAGADVIAENSVPPRVLIGAAAFELPEAELAFLVASALHSLRVGGPILRKLDVVEIAALFRTIAALLLDEKPPPGPFGKTLAALPFRTDMLDFSDCKRIAKELQVIADAGAQGSIRAAERSSNSVGLLVCRDVYAALCALYRREAWSEDAATDVASRTAAIQQDGSVLDLVRFAAEFAPGLWPY